jgi:hypothetical protein
MPCLKPTKEARFKEAVLRWAKEVLPGSVKPGVAKRYLVSIGQMADHFGELRVAEIDAASISSYISSRSGAATNATIRRDLTALSRLLSSCVAWGWLQSNPARLFDRSIIRERRDPISPPADDDVETLIAASPPGVARILRLLEQTGMRENEAVTLAASDVDRGGKQIRLIRTKTNRPRTLDWRTPGGDAGIVLDAAVPPFLNAYGRPYRNFASNVNQITLPRDSKVGRSYCLIQECSRAGRALPHQNAPGAAMLCQAAHGRNARLRLLVIHGSGAAGCVMVDTAEPARLNRGSARPTFLFDQRACFPAPTWRCRGHGRAT